VTEALQAASMQDTVLVEVDRVTVRRADLERPVLQEVSFHILPGERVALLGANGSGKTTLVHLLNGTLTADAGSVRVHGRDVADPQGLAAARRAVGLLFQDPDNQFVTTTVDREIAFGLENLQIPPDVMRQKVEEALAAFDLERYRAAPPHEMSGGEKARLALACVWVMGAQLLVLDETESLLDRRARERLAVQLAALPAGTAVLHVTTEAEHAAEMDRVLVLHEGRLIADGPPDDVWRRLDPDVSERIGLPLAWRLSRRLQEAGVGGAATGSWQRLCDRMREGRP